MTNVKATRTMAEMRDAERAALSPEDRAVDDRAMIYTALIMAASHAEARAKYWARLLKQTSSSAACLRRWRKCVDEHEYSMRRYRELAAQYGGAS